MKFNIRLKVLGFVAAVLASGLAENVQAQVCSNEVDIWFMNDSSGSVDYTEFQASKSFMNSVVSQFDLADNKFRAGLIDWNTVARLIIPATGNASTFATGISTYPDYSGSDRIGSMLTAANSNFIYSTPFTDGVNSAGSRENVKKLVVLMTDMAGFSGGSTDQNALIAASNLIRDDGSAIMYILIEEAASAYVNDTDAYLGSNTGFPETFDAAAANSSNLILAQNYEQDLISDEVIGAVVSRACALGSEISNPPSDAAGPNLVSSSPADGATAVAIDANIALTFDEPVVTGGGSIYLYDWDGEIIEVFNSSDFAISADGLTVTLNPLDDLYYDSGYYLKIAGPAWANGPAVKDLAGNGYAGSGDNNEASVLNFWTGAAPNTAPLVNAGNDQTVSSGASVDLAATATDADGDNLTISWQQTSGTQVSLTGSNTLTPSFAAPTLAYASTPLTLTFEVSVDDGIYEPVTDTVDVVVTPDYLSVDLCGYVNTNPSVPADYPVGAQITGNTGSNIPFTTCSYGSGGMGSLVLAGANTSPAGSVYEQTIDVPDVAGQKTFYALLNNYYGTANENEYTVTVNFTDGSSQSFNSIGGVDTRDFNQNPAATNTVGANTELLPNSWTAFWFF